MFRSSQVAHYAVAVGLVFSGFTVASYLLGAVSKLVVCSLPAQWVAAFVVCRAIRGMPMTMSGTTGLHGPRNKTGNPRYQLVTMPLNHFGEKVRWVP